MELKGKTAFVTGGAKRVGRSISLRLARGGANVVVNYRSSIKEAESLLEEITKLGSKAIALQGDVSIAADVSKMVSAAARQFGSIDILINNAAIYPKTPFDKLTEHDWDTTLDTNLKGPFLCSKAVGDLMLKGSGGKIINIADWAGIRPYLDYMPYCVSKAGVIALTKALAITLAPKVQVNCIAPGPIMLPDDLSEEERNEVFAKTPLKRVGAPEDIAETVAFLVQGSDFITGAVIPVDGGRLIA
ncbi:MAG: 3-oxoacyl-ACP reductase FabG [Dehalococcoidia bacterium]|nr:3-oxoacyl-ACP reductase FabG [Dehalococcoidia bacterium]